MYIEYFVPFEEPLFLVLCFLIFLLLLFWGGLSFFNQEELLFYFLSFFLITILLRYNSHATELLHLARAHSSVVLGTLRRARQSPLHFPRSSPHRESLGPLAVTPQARAGPMPSCLLSLRSGLPWAVKAPGKTLAALTCSSAAGGTWTPGHTSGGQTSSRQ